MNEWIGVQFVALAELRWSHGGEQFIMHPGDVFELDEADLAFGGMDPAMWLRAGNVLRAEEWPAYQASLSAEQMLALDEAAIESHERHEEQVAEEAKEREARQRAVARKSDKAVKRPSVADDGPGFHAVGLEV